MRQSCNSRRWVSGPGRSIRLAVAPLVEPMESRVLLSAYTLSQIGYFGANAAGANPQSTLVADSSGNLYGTASKGGAYGVGTVFEIANGSSAITTLASFNGSNGQNPYAGVTVDASGNLLGTTQSGGASNDGTVFEITKGSNAITTLATFNGNNGAQPVGGITLDGAGNLYGTTANGGAAGAGTVFEIAKGSATLTTLAAFDGNAARTPYCPVTIDGSGNLWGTTENGGASQAGAVFEIARGSNAITIVASFTASSGSSPTGAVALDGSGNLYGTTEKGGTSVAGTVFEVAAGSHAVTTLASLGGTNGQTPAAGLTIDASGNLYGTAESGGANTGGTVFEIAKGSTTLTTLVSSAHNEEPIGGVTLDASGDVYATTYQGGTHGFGSVFEVAKGSGAVTTVASFGPTNGQSPDGGVAMDAAGNLYGTTRTGGQLNLGTVFEIARGSTTATDLASFDGTHGSYPQAGVTLDSAGNVYGTTNSGGTSGRGVVFEIANGSSTITTLASFSVASGPSQLTLDGLGNLYGTTSQGGAYGGGSAFEVAKGSNLITTLASFNSTTGEMPYGGVMLDSSGNLYGTTSDQTDGGPNSNGTVFEIAQGSSTITTLASFNDTNGQRPYGGVTRDAAGNLFGTTYAGGAYNNSGTVFEIAAGTKTITTLASFNPATSGWNPDAGVTLDGSGDIFGTTYGGGANGDGTVFEIAAGSKTITTLTSFNGNNGSGPVAGVILDASGNIYGTTYYGGASGDGVVFEMATHSTVTLALTNGSNPSNASQSLSFTATVNGGVPDGETLTLVDSSNNNAVIATGTLSNGSASLNVPAGTLLAGTHNLLATYGGDANFAPGQSTAYGQVVQVSVTGVTVNGNLPALGGVQRSMVNSIVYAFSEAVNVAANAFSIAVHSGQTGTAPTLNWAALNPNSDGSSSQWVVTFSGPGVVGGSIGDGVYDITLNNAAVTSDANPSVRSQTRPTDTFYRLFGDAQGTGKVNAADYNAFLSSYGLKSGSAGYLGYFADDGSTKIDAADYNAFLGNYGKKLSGFTVTI